MEDQVPAKFVKEAVNGLAYPLAKIINLSIKTICIPRECKIVKQKPLFQKRLKD